MTKIYVYLAIFFTWSQFGLAQSVSTATLPQKFSVQFSEEGQSEKANKNPCRGELTVELNILQPSVKILNYSTIGHCAPINGNSIVNHPLNIRSMKVEFDKNGKWLVDVYAFSNLAIKELHFMLTPTHNDGYIFRAEMALKEESGSTLYIPYWTK